MEFSSLSFILTDDCNFNCSYCFQKEKGRAYLHQTQLRKAVDFFSQYLASENQIYFTGGEPLLAFEQIQYVIESIQAKNIEQKRQIQFCITTNGSLIDDDVFDFMHETGISLILSYDGLAQDITREKESSHQLVRVIKKALESPRIHLEVNSVFTPRTVGLLSQSIHYIMEMGVPTITFAFDKIRPWDYSSLIQLREELTSMSRLSIEFYKERGTIPLEIYKNDSKPALFYCSAGEDRMVIAPDGKIWGCHLFPEYFKGKEKTPEFHQYCFGEIDTFIENFENVYPNILKNHSDLRMDNFYTDRGMCKACDLLSQCSICPMDAALSSDIIGKIPIWTCVIHMLQGINKDLFREEIRSIE
jgi:radical SAM protein with 4Fe4S-binding SPASM domain